MARPIQPSLEQRLAKTPAKAREHAQLLPPGKERDELVSRAQECDRALKINAWVTSPGLRPSQ
jgi:hypothetical protein